jgi:predicted phosphoribosyltransferase
MFENRTDAGQKLARALRDHQGRDILVLSIPRGGAPVGFEIAKSLKTDFSLLIVRKLPFPNNPESGFGAIAEEGSMVLLNIASRWLSEETINGIVAEQKEEIQRRIQILRGGRPLTRIRERIVILVDDGIAMGSTMRAAIRACQKKSAGKIVVAAPVASPEIARKIDQMEAVDDTVILRKPKFFRAVAQVYRNWVDVADHEVIEIMKEWRRHYALT